jgi:exodeoxyribonuclease X
VKIAVLDTETTGLSEIDQVVEVGVVTMTKAKRGGWNAEGWSSLVKPSCPVSVMARANHHISDAELAKARPMSKVLPELRKVLADADIWAAHNQPFDMAMLLQSGVGEKDLPAARICTLHVAKHLLPECPAYGNNVIRYYVGAQPLIDVDGPPHRALPDAAVTAGNLEFLLRKTTTQEMIDLMSQQPLLRTVHFGQHRGRPWAEMDRGYLNWILSKDFDDDVKHTARYYLQPR